MNKKRITLLFLTLLILGSGAWYYLQQRRTEPSGMTLAEVREAINKVPAPAYGEPPKVLGTYKGKTLVKEYVCFGDVCPDNGGVMVIYERASVKTKEDCEKIGENPVMGYGWGPVYGGCSPKLEDPPPGIIEQITEKLVGVIQWFQKN